MSVGTGVADGAGGAAARGTPSLLHALATHAAAISRTTRRDIDRRYAAAPSHGSRADLVHHLAQQLADRAADAAGQPRRPLPRLDGDLVLPDQLAVTSDDLVRAAPAGDVARAATAHLLLHRWDLLDEPVPPGLAAALGVADALAAGREECAREA